MNSSVWRRAFGAAGALSFAASVAACSPAGNGQLVASATGNAVSPVPVAAAPQGVAADAPSDDAGQIPSAQTQIAGNFTAPQIAPVPEPRPHFPGDVQLAIKTNPAAADLTNAGQEPATTQVAVVSASRNPASQNPTSESPEKPATAGLSPDQTVAKHQAATPSGDGLAETPPSRRQQEANFRRTLAYSPAVLESGGVTTTATAIAGRRARRIRVASLDSGIGIGSPGPGQQVERAPVERAPVAITNRPLVSGQNRARGWSAAYPHVVTHCFGPDLRRALNAISLRFGQEVKVTSGHRYRGRRRSMHRACRAADIRVPGVRPSVVARFARSLPYLGGVGTYRRKSIVHIDTRANRMVWRY